MERRGKLGVEKVVRDEDAECRVVAQCLFKSRVEFAHGARRTQLADCRTGIGSVCATDDPEAVRLQMMERIRRSCLPIRRSELVEESLQLWLGFGV